MLTSSWTKTLRPLVIAAVAGALSVAVLPAQQAQAATVTYQISTLGDSWASGEGNPPYSSDPACDRSNNSWSHQVKLPNGHTVDYSISTGSATLQVLACQGATTANITDKSQVIDGTWTRVPQIGPANVHATHVFLSISGNDMDFGYIMENCFQACQGTINQARPKISAAMKGLTRDIKMIHTNAPQAQIILTGYAPLVGVDSYWKDNATLLKSFALEFNAEEKATVKSLQNLGIDVDFVDLVPTFAGHGDGDVSKAWILPPDFGTRYALHPNRDGVAEIARLVSKVVEQPFTGSCSGNVSSGMTGNCVREVQNHLNAWGSSLTVDGDFGAKTKAAVVAFQKAHKLSADGIVGPKTKAALFQF